MAYYMYSIWFNGAYFCCYFCMLKKLSDKFTRIIISKSVDEANMKIVMISFLNYIIYTNFGATFLGG